MGGAGGNVQGSAGTEFGRVTAVTGSGADERASESAAHPLGTAA